MSLISTARSICGCPTGRRPLSAKKLFRFGEHHRGCKSYRPLLGGSRFALISPTLEWKLPYSLNSVILKTTENVSLGDNILTLKPFIILPQIDLDGKYREVLWMSKFWTIRKVNFRRGTLPVQGHEPQHVRASQVVISVL